MTIPLKKVAKRWMKEPGFKEGYDALEDEFALASQLIEARSRAGLTQAEVAETHGHQSIDGGPAGERRRETEPLDS